MELAKISASQTMSSLEIAELTGKRHEDVLRDLRKILEEAEVEATQFCVPTKMPSGQTATVYNLPRRECDLVVSGYSVKYRLAIIDRWQELEAMQSPVHKVPQTLAVPNFSNPAEAARAWADQYEARLLAESTKAQIGSKREATAMNTASQAVRHVNKLQIELDQSKQYASIKRMENIYHGQKFNWRLLKDAAMNLDISAVDIFDANYGTVKAYHADVWAEAYALKIE